MVGRQASVSFLWEITQGLIAVAITFAVIYLAIIQVESSVIENAFFFVVATYVTRTNHQRIGGVGPKANEVSEPQYRGR